MTRDYEHLSAKKATINKLMDKVLEQEQSMDAKDKIISDLREALLAATGRMMVDMADVRAGVMPIEQSLKDSIKDAMKVLQETRNV